MTSTTEKRQHLPKSWLAEGKEFRTLRIWKILDENSSTFIDVEVYLYLLLLHHLKER